MSVRQNRRLVAETGRPVKGLNMLNRIFLLFGFAITFLAASAVEAAKPNADEVAYEVNRLLAKETGGDSSETVPQTDDETFLRRVFFDVIGEAPTPEDVFAFAFQDADNKRTQIVDQLLADKSFGVNWARYWRDVVMYRKTEERALASIGAMTDYLTEQLNNNTSWDKIATEFITATGNVREVGSTALIMAQSGRPEDVTAEVSRIFMGIQIQCAQCHDHPTDRWKRQQFHELAAFFPRVAIRPDRSGDIPTFHVVVNDRPFNFRRRTNNNNRYVGTPEHYMPNLDDPTDRGAKTQPVFFVSGEKLDFGTKDADRRGTIAEWITSSENPWFANAFVNRVWAELVGEGFYEPVDDMGPDRECSAPKTMEYLASSFAGSGYDVKWLYRTITATDVYQRQSRNRRDYDELPFQANCAQRLRADQLFDSLVSVLDLEGALEGRSSGRGAGPYRGRNTPRAAFNIAFGFDPSEPRAEVGSSVQQALAVMNAPFVNQAINARRPDGLGKILSESRDDKDALVELYLKTLSRGPSDYETRTCLSYLRQVNDRNEAFEDILWSLVNSTEFLHRK